MVQEGHHVGSFTTPLTTDARVVCASLAARWFESGFNFAAESNDDDGDGVVAVIVIVVVVARTQRLLSFVRPSSNLHGAWSTLVLTI